MPTARKRAPPFDTARATLSTCSKSAIQIDVCEALRHSSILSCITPAAEKSCRMWAHLYSQLIRGQHHQD